jgi:hypothetical protein
MDIAAMASVQARHNLQFAICNYTSLAHYLLVRPMVTRVWITHQHLHVAFLLSAAIRWWIVRAFVEEGIGYGGAIS